MSFSRYHIFCSVNFADNVSPPLPPPPKVGGGAFERARGRVDKNKHIEMECCVYKLFLIELLGPKSGYD